MRKRVFLVLFLLAILQSAFPQAKKDCKQIVFSGEVEAGEVFTREIGNELRFYIKPDSQEEPTLGWNFEIGPIAPPEEFDQYIAIYSFMPCHGRTVQNICTRCWGILAQDAVNPMPRTFLFLLDREKEKAAWDAFDQAVLICYNGDPNKGLKKLGQIPHGSGEFRILDSKITSGTTRGDCAPDHCGALHWIKFQVKLIVPRTFKPAAGLSAEPATCPDWSKILD
jgi:hypothetical protein